MKSINLIPIFHSVHNAMVLTARDVLTEYSPLSVFTCSDEITLSFGNELQIPFAGRKQKILSCIAGFTSVHFTHHLKNQNFSDNPEVKS